MERTKLLQTRSLHFISWISSRRQLLCFIIQMMNNLKRLAQIHTNSFHPKGLCETRLTLHPEWKSSSTTSHSKAFHWAHDKSHHSAIKIMAQGVLNATVQRVQRVRWTSGSSNRFSQFLQSICEISLVLRSEVTNASIAEARGLVGSASVGLHGSLKFCLLLLIVCGNAIRCLRFRVLMDSFVW